MAQNETNVIRTLFEFTSSGYEEAKGSLDACIEKSASLRKEEEALRKGHRQAAQEVDTLVKKWSELNAAMGKATPREVREYYASLPRLIEQATAAQVRAAGRMQENAKAQAALNKQLSDARGTAEAYAKVLAKLNGQGAGTGQAVRALGNALRELGKELAATDFGTGKYRELSHEMALVQQGLTDLRTAQEQQTRGNQSAGNSVASMREQYRTLREEWEQTDRTDPGFAQKTAQVEELSEELETAQQDMGLFSDSVRRYVTVGNTAATVLGKFSELFPGLSGGLKAVQKVLELQGSLFKAAADNAGLLTKAKKALSAASTRLAAALGISNIAAQALMATLTLGLSAAIGAVIYLWDKFSSQAKKSREEALAFGKATSEMAAESMQSFEGLQAKWESLGDSLEARQKFVEQNREAFRKLGAEVGNVEEAENILQQNSQKFKEALMLRAQAAAAAQLATEKYKLALEKQLESETLAAAGKNRKSRKAAEAAAEARGDYEKAFAMQADYAEKEKGLLDQIGVKAAETGQKQAKAADSTAKAYTDAAKARLKAEEELYKAQAEGDTARTRIYEAVLTEREKVLEAASAKRLKLSQEEKAALELAELQHSETLAKIAASAAAKRTAEEEKSAAREKQKQNGYLQATAAYRSAQSALLEAQKRGNAEEVALYQRQLDQKRAALDAYEQQQVQLDAEQQLSEEMAVFEQQQKAIADYVALRTQLAELQKQYDAAATEADKAAVQKQVEALKAKVEFQAAALQAMGIEADKIAGQAAQSADKVKQQLTDSLGQALQQIEKFSGGTKGTFGKLGSDLNKLLAKTFDFKDATKGMDKASAEFKKLKDDMKEGLKELAVATAIDGVAAAADAINQGLERQKQSIDEMYAAQEKRAQEAYDSESATLQTALDRKEISQAKYRIEQGKLDDKKAKEDKKREKEKAEALYDIELKQFRVKQAQDAIGAVIATSLGIAKSMPNFILAGIVAAMGAVQVATIYAQKPPQKPKFAKGGGIRFGQIEGPSHAQGGVPISFGDDVVAEAEGDEGALIISKRAMKNTRMRRMLRQVEDLNRGISGGGEDAERFEDGGFLDYAGARDEFIRKHGIQFVDKRPYRSGRWIVFDGAWKHFKTYAKRTKWFDQQADAYWEQYQQDQTRRFEEQSGNIQDRYDKGLAGNAYLKSQGVTDMAGYNERVSDTERDLDAVNDQIKAYEDLAKAKTDALKASLDYDARMAEFEKRRTDAADELAQTTQAFNARMLKELRDDGQITEQEYRSMLDQIEHGYGVTTSDILALKKKQVEAMKALIEEERDAEIEAAKESAKYREDALAQIRSEWEQEYDSLTQQIIDDVENASDAVSRLTGTDLERYNQLIDIEREVKRMNEEYAQNDSLLTDGVIQSREERAALVAEQKRIREELARKEQEAEAAKAAFEAEREKNMETARKAYETENFAALLEQIKALGAEMQAEGSKWNLDKELAAQLDAQLQGINDTYDEQLAKQDAVIDSLQAEIDAAKLLHDQKVAYIKEEENALKAAYESQKAAIDKWLEDTLSEMRAKALSLNGVLAALKAAGYEAGLSEYEKAMEDLNALMDDYKDKGGEMKQYATGGAIELGSGLYQVAGPPHALGGVPVYVGETQVAEVEGIEKMLAVNKLAAHDPEMVAALAKASEINARYTGTPLLGQEQAAGGFSLDYDLLAEKIGAQINMRPSKTFLTHRDVRSAYEITEMHRRSSYMK